MGYREHYYQRENFTNLSNKNQINDELSTSVELLMLWQGYTNCPRFGIVSVKTGRS